MSEKNLKWSVEIDVEAEFKLREDFQSGRISAEDIKVIRRWGAVMARKMNDVLKELVPEAASPGELLRALRKRDGLTLKDMEEITSLRDNNLSAIENGRIEMSKHYAEIFAAALDVHPMIFLYPNGKFEKTPELLQIEKRAAKRRRMG